MSKFFTSIVSFMSDREDPYVRLAEVEYGAEFKHLVNALGRRPTNREAKTFLINFG